MRGEQLGVKNNLISIIVPTYNCGRKVADTIDSVLSQSGDSYELIVVDGGSKDETLEVINKYGSNLTLISEADRGLYDAMNKGIRISTGKYLLFLGAGDRLRDGIISRMAPVLPKRKLCLVYGNSYWVRYGTVTSGAFSIEKLRSSNICHQVIFYDRRLFQLLGQYDIKYPLCADWVFNMKCFAHPGVSKIYHDLVVADFEGWGLSDTQHDYQFLADLPSLIDKYIEKSPRRISSRAFAYSMQRFSTSATTVVTLLTSLLTRQKP